MCEIWRQCRLPGCVSALVHSLTAAAGNTQINATHTCTHRWSVCNCSGKNATKAPSAQTVTVASLPESSASSSGSSGAGAGALQPGLLAQQALVLFSASAILGPLCDGLHSAADVLHYKNPSVQLHLDFGGASWGLETWWVWGVERTPGAHAGCTALQTCCT